MSETKIKMNLQKLSRNAPLLNLSKVAKTPLKRLQVQVAWGGDYDLDLTGFGCKLSPYEERADSFIFTPAELAKIQAGEMNDKFENMLFFHNQMTGYGTLPEDILAGDDEPEKVFIEVDRWLKYCPDVEVVNLWMSIYNKPDSFRRDSFGEVENAVVSLINADTQELIQEYAVGKADPESNSMFIGALSVKDGELLFKPKGVDGTPMNGKIDTILDVLTFYFV